MGYNPNGGAFDSAMNLAGGMCPGAGMNKENNKFMAQGYNQ